MFLTRTPQAFVLPQHALTLLLSVTFLTMGGGALAQLRGPVLPAALAGQTTA